MDLISSGISIIFIIVFFIVQAFISFIPIIMIVLVITTIAKRTNNAKFFKQNVIVSNAAVGSKAFENNYKEVSKAQLSKFGIDDINDIKNYLYEIFYNFENAYNNLDLQEMKRYSYEQLCENYITGIKLDKKLGKKKVISDITKIETLLTQLDSTKHKQMATMIITINYLNYIVDKKGDLISGDRVSHITETFEVEFRKDRDENRPLNCPNCGGKIDSDDVICDYCSSPIGSSDEFRIYSIRKIISK